MVEDNFDVEAAVRDIVNALNQCAAILRDAGETWWLPQVEDAVANADTNPNVVNQIRGWFGGMGSLSELRLSAKYGHTVDPQAEEAINKRLQRLLETAFRRATELKRVLLRQGVIRR